MVEADSFGVAFDAWCMSSYVVAWSLWFDAWDRFQEYDEVDGAGDNPRQYVHLGP